MIYVGNGDGILEFDGAHWRLIQVANGTEVRSLAVDGAGRIDVGANGELGALESDALGRNGLFFVDGTDSLRGPELCRSLPHLRDQGRSVFLHPQSDFPG